MNLSHFGLKAETGKVQFDKYREYAQPTDSGEACRLIWAENTQRYAWRTSDKRISNEWLSKEFIFIIPPSITDVGIMTQRISANEQPRRIIASLVIPKGVGSDVVYSENHTNFIEIGDEVKGVLFYKC